MYLKGYAEGSTNSLEDILEEFPFYLAKKKKKKWPWAGAMGTFQPQKCKLILTAKSPWQSEVPNTPLNCKKFSGKWLLLLPYHMSFFPKLPSTFLPFLSVFLQEIHSISPLSLLPQHPLLTWNEDHSQKSHLLSQNPIHQSPLNQTPKLFSKKSQWELFL